MRASASAPGKLVLAGEYAVLEGYPALVTAVDRRVFLTLDVAPSGELVPSGERIPSDAPPRLRRPRVRAELLHLGSSVPTPSLPAAPSHRSLGHPSSSPPPEAIAVLEEVFGPEAASDFQVAVDRSALYEGGHKLGLGSSAATAAAVAWAACALRDGAASSGGPRWLSPSRPSTAVAADSLVAGLDERRRADVLSLALRGHAVIAPQGSGVDVVASVCGGTRVVVRTAAGLDTRVAALPQGLSTSIVFTGASARTSDLVATVRAHATTAPREYTTSIEAIAHAAMAMIAAAEGDDAPAFIEAARLHAAAMTALGRRAGAPIVDDRLAHLVTLAEAAGGAAKPSGAGGGDVALAFFESDEARLAFERSLAGVAAVKPVRATLGALGALTS